jgi:SPFH domain / Band 7 family
MKIVLILLVVLTLAILLFGALILVAGLRHVPDRRIGIVYRKYGGRHPQDEFRVSLHGSMGPQAAVLRPNTRQWLTPFLYHVRYIPQVHVPDGTIGLVQAKDGKVRPAGRRLSKYVECDYFQDGAAFLQQAGEQGRQLGYLPGGARYSINMELFDVITVDTVGQNQQHGVTAADLKEIMILEGYVGVVIVLDGKPPSEDQDVVGRVVEGHYSYRLPWVFLGRGGQRGVQKEILDGGSSYAISSWFARVVHVPTLELLLEWTSKSLKDVGNFDSALDQIVVDIQGHRLRLEMSQVLRVPAEAAPRLVRRFGEGEMESAGSAHGDPLLKPAPVRRFVERVLGAAVAGYFTEIVAEYQVLPFIRQYDKVRMDLQDRVTHALADWNVVAGQTVLGEFEAEDQELSKLRRELTRGDLELTQAERRRPLLEALRSNKDLEAQIEQIEIGLKGESNVVVLRKQIEVLGSHTWLMDRILMHMAKMPVPNYVSGGGGSGDMADRILGLMPFSNAQDMLKSLLQSGPEQDPAIAQPTGTAPEEQDDQRPINEPLDAEVTLPANDEDKPGTDPR